MGPGQLSALIRDYGDESEASPECGRRAPRGDTLSRSTNQVAVRRTPPTLTTSIEVGANPGVCEPIYEAEALWT
jgi:hypothetical protein